MNLRALKRLTNWIPETYLFLSVIYYWVMTGTFLNPIAVFLLAVLIILTWLKNRILGIVIATLFLLLNLYMVLALLSDLTEFSTFNRKALIFLVVGGTYLGLNIFFSIRMLIKWTFWDDESTVLNLKNDLALLSICISFQYTLGQMRTIAFFALFIIAQLIVHEVVPGESDVAKNVKKQGDIYLADYPYDENFWKTFNMPVDTQLSRKIKADLNARENLIEQFKNNSASKAKK